jgi:hypothetical protein
MRRRARSVSVPPDDTVQGVIHHSFDRDGQLLRHDVVQNAFKYVGLEQDPDKAPIARARATGFGGTPGWPRSQNVAQWTALEQVRELEVFAEHVEARVPDTTFEFGRVVTTIDPSGERGKFQTVPKFREPDLAAAAHDSTIAARGQGAMIWRPMRGRRGGSSAHACRGRPDPGGRPRRRDSRSVLRARALGSARRAFPAVRRELTQDLTHDGGVQLSRSVASNRANAGPSIIRHRPGGKGGAWAELDPHLTNLVDRGQRTRKLLFAATGARRRRAGMLMRGGDGRV